MQLGRPGRGAGLMHDRATHYETLGVPGSARREEITAAFRRAAKLWHPDVNAEESGAGERMKQLAAAYEVLRDPYRRAAYDDWLRSNDSRGGEGGEAKGAGRPEARWWEAETPAGEVSIVSDSGPPDGYLASAALVSWRRLVAVLSSASHSLSATCGADGDHGVSARVGFLCLALCPFFAFLLAGWRARAPRLIGFSALYGGANALSLLRPGYVVVTVPAYALSVAGVIHCVRWRTRLLDAIDLRYQTRGR